MHHKNAILRLAQKSALILLMKLVIYGIYLCLLYRKPKCELPLMITTRAFSICFPIHSFLNMGCPYIAGHKCAYKHCRRHKCQQSYDYIFCFGSEILIHDFIFIFQKAGENLPCASLPGLFSETSFTRCTIRYTCILVS